LLLSQFHAALLAKVAAGEDLIQWRIVLLIAGQRETFIAIMLASQRRGFQKLSAGAFWKPSVVGERYLCSMAS
jgi:hypothetical protein